MKNFKFKEKHPPFFAVTNSVSHFRKIPVPKYAVIFRKRPDEKNDLQCSPHFFCPGTENAAAVNHSSSAAATLSIPANRIWLD